MTATKGKFDFTTEVEGDKKQFDGPRYIKLSAKDAKKQRVVTITEVINGTTTHGEPFIKVKIADDQGYIAENDFFINTIVKEGKKTSSFNVSRTDFVKLLVVTGKTEQEAKDWLETAKDDADLAIKLSIAVGKPFKMGFWGKIVTSSKGQFLKTMFAQGKNNIMPKDTVDAQINTNSQKDETNTFLATLATKDSGDGKTTGKSVDDLPF